MAETDAVTEQVGNGSDTRKTALRAAAIAAASGATAIAAKRAFSDRQGSSGSGSKQQNGGSSAGGDSMISGMVGTGWNAAKDTLVPFAEEAANAAGEYLGRNGPDFVTDTIVPAFIEGFQSAKKESAGGE
jgi:hypothetical protein